MSQTCRMPAASSLIKGSYLSFPPLFQGPLLVFPTKSAARRGRPTRETDAVIQWAAGQDLDWTGLGFGWRDCVALRSLFKEEPTRVGRWSAGKGFQSAVDGGATARAAHVDQLVAQQP